MDWLRRHALGWATSAAATLTAAQIVTPSFADWILDWIVVALVAVAAKLAKQA
jgi:hypothetical protein